MTGRSEMVNTVEALPETQAPLRNVVLLNELMVRLINRRRGEDNFGAFYGLSGLGKSCAAAYCRNKHRAVLIRAGSTWDGRYLAEQIANSLRVRDLKKSTPRIVEQIISALLHDHLRPIIIDEADFIVKKSIIEVLRDISDNSHNPVILIGEPDLKTKLSRWDRVADRVLEWVEPVPCDLADTRQLARLYAPGRKVDDDLLQHICAQTEGRARRIVRHLGRVVEIALERGLDHVRLADWDGQALPAEAV